jgi:hypothetical protein
MDQRDMVDMSERGCPMDYLVFYLAEARDIDMLVDDGFVSTREQVLPKLFPTVADAEEWARDICRGWQLEYIDCDGPFWVPLWVQFGHFRRPKWQSQAPAGIASERWKTRLKSTDELRAYRAGLKAAKSRD